MLLSLLLFLPCSCCLSLKYYKADSQRKEKKKLLSILYHQISKLWVAHEAHRHHGPSPMAELITKWLEQWRGPMAKRTRKRSRWSMMMRSRWVYSIVTDGITIPLLFFLTKAHAKSPRKPEQCSWFRSIRISSINESSEHHAARISTRSSGGVTIEASVQFRCETASGQSRYGRLSSRCAANSQRLETTSWCRSVTIK